MKNFKTLVKKLKKTPQDGKPSHAHGSVGLIVGKWHPFLLEVGGPPAVGGGAQVRPLLMP